MDAIELYVSSDGNVSLQVKTDNTNAWLTRQQMADMFGRDVKTIGKHIGNALREELQGTSVVAKFATTASDGKVYQVEHYDLDMILSVGYRVKSSEGVHFRRWANDVLKRYVIEGAAVNEWRLEQLGQIFQIMGRADNELISGVADVLTSYLPGLTLLRDYDEGAIAVEPATEPGWRLTIDEARSVIAGVAAEFPKDTLFGIERGDALAGVVETIYQGFSGQDLYPTVEEKAANLLYLVIKDHPLSDGNKRSAAALFVVFLSNNGLLYDKQGKQRISNNALAAITLMIAMSDPKEKELMIALLMRMIEADAGLL